MQAAFYKTQGSAAEVLQIGEVETPDPGQGEVLVSVRASGCNPSDVKLRAGARPMGHDRIIPHSDGAGIIKAVGAGVDPA
ncbi:MAG: NADPH:quinone reductase, partial [Rhodobacteraceae bacterium]|nr:NADPH:quinone reductase [Paracoccaceae bacterium]